MRFAVIVSEEGINCRSWRRWRFVHWDEIAELSYGNAICLVIRTRNGWKFDVPIFVTRLQQFLVQCERHLPKRIISSQVLEKLANPSNIRWVWFAIQTALVGVGIGIGGSMGKGAPGLGRASGEELGKLLGVFGAAVLGQVIEAAVGWYWPVLKSPPFLKPTYNDAGQSPERVGAPSSPRHGLARRVITSLCVYLVLGGMMLIGLAMTGSWMGGLALPVFAVVVLAGVAWVWITV